MKEKEGKTLTLNEKGVLLIGIIILTLTFALGFISSKKREESITIFTREDLERIAKLQEMEDESKSGAEIFAYKDEDGNLMIGWDYNGSKKNR